MSEGSIYERLKAIDADTHGNGWEDAEWEIIHYEALPAILALIEAAMETPMSAARLDDAIRALTEPRP